MSNTVTANNTRYGKPNMAALEGEWGRRIFEQIRNTPRVDYEKLARESAEISEKIRGAREDGTY